MATANQKNAASENAEDLAVPPGVNAPAGPTTSHDLANAPEATQPVVSGVAVKAGLSGATVKIQLAAGEGAAGKDAQFVRVNEHTWLVPRNVPTIVPVEAYQALSDTLPPVPEGADYSVASPRFSVSVLERYPAPQLNG